MATENLPRRDIRDIPEDREANTGISTTLAAQHAVHGAFGEVFRRKGGIDGLHRWADENETAFYRIFARLAPTMQPQAGLQGDVHVHVHNSLGQTALDGKTTLDGEAIDAEIVDD